jgi:hypothetical protein
MPGKGEGIALKASKIFCAEPIAALSRPHVEDTYTYFSNESRAWHSPTPFPHSPQPASAW